uniref:Putative nuclease HARBI1 n=1 Tax=Takifugu rubripes TaxID=31033 RepID=A0A3B5KFM0_TAKRU
CPPCCLIVSHTQAGSLYYHEGSLKSGNRLSKMTALVHVIQQRQRQHKPRQYTERPNILLQYSDEELYSRYRFGTQDIIYLCDVLRPHLQRPTVRSHALTGGTGVDCSLFFGSGLFFEMCVHSVARALSSLLNEYVKFPENEEEISQNKKQLFSIAGMPNTIGMIDCTHIHIQAPHEREWEFVNRKGRHSINVQLIGNADLQIINCVVRWPGSVHDSRILRESHIYHRFQQNTPDGILLGDSGYPLLCWLMTPFATVTSNSQQNFNYAHTSTWETIERINGILKPRFACLNYFRVEPKEACNIICACIVLHNIAQKRRVPMEEDNSPLPEGLIEAPQPHQTDEPAGRAVRSAMTQRHQMQKTRLEDQVTTLRV